MVSKAKKSVSSRGAKKSASVEVFAPTLEVEDSAKLEARDSGTLEVQDSGTLEPQESVALETATKTRGRSKKVVPVAEVIAKSKPVIELETKPKAQSKQKRVTDVAEPLAIKPKTRRARPEVLLEPEAVLFDPEAAKPVKLEVAEVTKPEAPKKTRGRKKLMPEAQQLELLPLETPTLEMPQPAFGLVSVEDSIENSFMPGVSGCTMPPRLPVRL